MTQHHVLVIEDDFEIRETLLDLLQDHGCEPVGAANGAEAMRYLLAADALPCLILLDLMMPVMDGPSFREAQLADPRLRDIPVVVLSAYRDVKSNAETMKAAAYLKKPPKLAELVTAVSTHC